MAQSNDHHRATVFVVDDDPEVRESLQWLLQSAGFEVMTFDSPQAFLDTYHEEMYGCVLLDLRMPEMDGLALQRQLTARGIRLPVIILSAHVDVPTAVEAMRAGAVDVLQKPFEDQLLIDRINQALREDASTREREDEHAEIVARVATLTPREREVLDRLVEGATSKAVAQALGISVRTAEVHRANVMRKMQARSLAELVTQVVRYRHIQDQSRKDS
ncbi:MAG: response regulator transcription factor [Gammaproteobacteria bacterium]|nr:response regulator transcription factor [Gammaproteobacteria bacterium]NIR82706.1 response regulator transcription factor [Gammaproteobacteria bacterium]NIR89570.1 response regulator transcription factor [Gammaproteobacteria bacterium]NIU03866.1 response regulator transcription factor [Gammaproteobacteria bacterium]NIX85140.1 response regulator [Gammaproteobacteria bacterium]